MVTLSIVFDVSTFYFLPCLAKWNGIHIFRSPSSIFQLVGLILLLCGNRGEMVYSRPRSLTFLQLANHGTVSQLTTTSSTYISTPSLAFDRINLDFDYGIIIV